MKYKNAGKGIKKAVIGQILAIISTFLGNGMALFLSVSSRVFGESYKEPSVLFISVSVFLGIASLCFIALKSVFSFIGYLQASRDEPEFKKATICVLTSGVLLIIGFFLQIKNGTLYTILNSASMIIEMFVMVFAISGVVNLSNSCERTDVAEKGDSVLRVLLVTFIFSALDALVIRIFELSENAWTVSLIIGTVDLILSFIQIIIFVRYLRQASKMLQNS